MNVIEIDNLWKEYRLGVIGHGTLTHDLQSWWAKLRGKEDPNEKISTRILTGEDKQIDGSSFYALRGFNLKVEQGEVLGIIGRNGAGKSTVLKILSRVTAPTRGVIRVKGRIASLLEVGTGFHPELTGLENVFMNGAILGMTKHEIRSKLDEIVDFAGVGEHIDTPVKRYSSGMYVRLAFAVAAHLDPEILVVDEVLAVGDAEFQKKCIGKMKDVSKKGRTILFVSHNMASIQALCSKAINIEHGLIKNQGNVSDVISSYVTGEPDGKIEFINRNEKCNEMLAYIVRAHVEVGNKKVGVAVCGSELTFKLFYKARRAGVRAALYIGIYNNHGEKLMHLGTLYGDGEPFKTKVEGMVSCKIKRLPLVGGSYSVNLSLHIDGKPYQRIENAFNLSIENGDYYGNGKLPDRKECKFLVEQFWSVN